VLPSDQREEPLPALPEELLVVVLEVVEVALSFKFFCPRITEPVQFVSYHNLK
jgi:hypothetical protein